MAFIVKGLQPKGEEERKRAEVAVRGGIGSGRGVFSIKALQFTLAAEAGPRSSLKDGKVKGYDLAFHETTYDNREVELTGEGDRPNPLTGLTTAFCMGWGGRDDDADEENDGDHDSDCRGKYGGLSSCPDIAGVDLNPHTGREISKSKPECFRSLEGMDFPSFTYSVRAMNELENERCNHRFLAQLLSSVPGHSSEGSTACLAALWACGRCFCSSPVMRVFDCFGRVDIVFLASALAAGAQY